MFNQSLITTTGFTLRQVKTQHKSRPKIDCWQPHTIDCWSVSTTPVETPIMRRYRLLQAQLLIGLRQWQTNKEADKPEKATTHQGSCEPEEFTEWWEDAGYINEQAAMNEYYRELNKR